LVIGPPLVPASRAEPRTLGAAAAHSIEHFDELEMQRAGSSLKTAGDAAANVELVVNATNGGGTIAMLVSSTARTPKPSGT
jgi:hypothetical protein